MKMSDKIAKRIMELQAKIAEIESEVFDEYDFGKQVAYKRDVEFLQDLLVHAMADEQREFFTSFRDEMLRNYQEQERKEK